MSHRPHSPDRLTRREREIMNAVFALGNRASAEDIRARLVDPPSDSSVRVMLARLEKKGALRHEQDGVRYLYSATTSTSAAKKTALRQFVETFFDGSVTEMMTSLLAEGSWRDEDLAELKTQVERARRERKPKP